jgi:hypothetical protein
MIKRSYTDGARRLAALDHGLARADPERAHGRRIALLAASVIVY